MSCNDYHESMLEDEISAHFSISERMQTDSLREGRYNGGCPIPGGCDFDFDEYECNPCLSWFYNMESKSIIK